MPLDGLFFLFAQHNSEFKPVSMFMHVRVHVCAMWDFSSRMQNTKVSVP